MARRAGAGHHRVDGVRLGRHRLGVGADLLRSGEADAVVAGGYDVLCRFVMRGFDALRALTRDEVRPFDRRRSGLLLGEAAALVLLAPRARGAGPRLGTLLGYGSASDASHISAPDPEGRGLERAVRAALGEAGVGADGIDFVSAHGTGTPLNDPIEAAVLRRVLGARAGAVPVNSIKPSLGHTMGAAAVLEALMCLYASPPRRRPADAHLDEPDPACDARLRARRAPRAAPADQPEHLPRLRRLQRGARAGGRGVMPAPVVRGPRAALRLGPGTAALPEDAHAAAAGRRWCPSAASRATARWRRATREGSDRSRGRGGGARRRGRGPRRRSPASARRSST